MSVLSISTKGKIGAKGVKTVARNPRILQMGAKAAGPVAKTAFRLGKPVAKRQARRRAQHIGQTAQRTLETLAVVPQAAQQLGLVEMPEPAKEKRTVPRVVAGVLIGAGAMYFLEPGAGREHRERLMHLVA